MHVSYTTHIASLHYIENLSMYVVSRRDLHIATNDTSLHEHSEVNRSKGQGQQKTPHLSGTFERSHGIFFINTARSKGQGQTSFPAKCV